MPSGKDARYFYFSSFQHSYINLNPDSWLSSTIYHIDSSRSPENISEWCGLDLTIINDVCKDETLKTVSLTGKLKAHVLAPPYPESNSNLWKLKIFFQGISAENVDNYGNLVFVSNPREKTCSLVEGRYLSFRDHFNLKRYCTLKTIINLSTKLFE